MTQMKKVIPYEIVSALIADRCRSDDGLMQSMRKNSTKAVASLLGGSDFDKDIRTAQNTPDLVHVALPHYPGQEDIASESQEVMSDEEMMDVSGGEIFIASIIAVAVSGTVASIVVGGTAAITAIVLTEDQGNLPDALQP